MLPGENQWAAAFCDMKCSEISCLVILSLVHTAHAAHNTRNCAPRTLLFAIYKNIYAPLGYQATFYLLVCSIIFLLVNNSARSPLVCPVSLSYFLHAVSIFCYLIQQHILAVYCQLLYFPLLYPRRGVLFLILFSGNNPGFYERYFMVAAWAISYI
jgi:hypothetical protein